VEHGCDKLPERSQLCIKYGENSVNKAPRPRPAGVFFILEAEARRYFAASITSWVQAPSGALVMTGSEPPDISVFTVRS